MKYPQMEAEFSRSAENAEIVNGNTLLKEFDSQTAAKLVELGIEARFEPGMLIFQEHDQEQSYYITSGSVALEQPGPDHLVRIQTFREGGFLGWAEFLGSATRHFQARALTPVAAIAFDRGLLRKASECNPRFGYALMKRFVL